MKELTLKAATRSFSSVAGIDLSIDRISFPIELD